MTRPRLLDLFCCAGGAGMGYHRAGFDVTGVDINPQPRYPLAFVQGDALAYLAARGHEYDAIHASPPCQAFTRASHLRAAQGGTSSHPDLVAPTRALLVAARRPWIMENVPGAPVQGACLCGSMFGLAVRRHRLFESSVLLMQPLCDHRQQGRPVGVYHRMGDEIPHGGRTARTLAEASDAMGIDWMVWGEITQAIPPAFTEYLGRQLLAALATAERAA